MTYSRVKAIGPAQVGGVHHHALPGIYPGFTQGLGGSGSMETLLNNWDAFTGGWTESTAFSLGRYLNSSPNVSPLVGTTRFVSFTAPMLPNGGSMQRMLNGEYDSLIDGSADAVVSLGLPKEQHGVRWGHEYNSGAGDSLTQGFPWATAHVDPYTGTANGLSKYKAAGAYMEGRWRARGFVGYAIWCGGNHDTSSAPIGTAIPTHGDPDSTAWDWDLYPGPPYNGTKNDVSLMIAHNNPIYDGYVAYCRNNGILMGHSELGQIISPASSQRFNDTGLIMPWLYGKMQAAADVIAWGIHYFQNSPYVGPGGTPVVLDELHDVAFGVSSTGGAPLGQASTTPWTGDYPPGTSGPNVNGSTNTLARVGSLQNSSDSGLHFVWSNDPASTQKRDSWQATFGGVGSLNGLGAEGLTVAVTPPVTPTNHSTARGRKVRRHYATFR
jgi:hypothetical protein